VSRQLSRGWHGGELTSKVLYTLQKVRRESGGRERRQRKGKKWKEKRSGRTGKLERGYQGRWNG